MLSRHVFVASQLSEDDVRVLASAGVRSLVCNRPDGEAEDQPEAAAVAAAALAAGLHFEHLPVKPGQFDEADIVRFDAAVAAGPHPLVAYCRSGQRSATLWALALAPRLGVEAVLDATRIAGHDLGKLRTQLQDRCERQTGAAQRDSATPA